MGIEGWLRKDCAFSLSVVVAASIAACGGGGSGGNSTDPNIGVTFQIRAAQVNSINTAKSYTMTGTGNDGKAYSITLSRTPGGTGVFPGDGQTYARAGASVVIRQDGVAITNSNAIGYYDAATSLAVGVVDSSGACLIPQQGIPVPLTAKVGDAGSAGTATQYSSCVQGRTTVGTYTASWSMESDAGIALLCNTSTFNNTVQGSSITQTQCFEIGADGSLKDRAKITLSVIGSFSVTAKNY
ncbi:MAG: hypothetical protein AB9M53_01870 [Leptothrix sp. (in: b-proteobacteria)]